MTTLKTLLRAALGVALSVILLPVFVWIGLAALGASVAAIILGTAVVAWQLRPSQKPALN